jgi:SLOG family YspA-like protein
MRVLVCGGRDFADSALLYDVLDELNRAKTIICVIEGDARGADRLVSNLLPEDAGAGDSFCRGKLLPIIGWTEVAFEFLQGVAK